MNAPLGPEVAPDALVISASPGRVRAALLERGETVEILIEDETMASRVGEIHRARVVAVNAATGDAHLLLADGRPGFLGAENQGRHRPSEGDSLLARVQRDARDGKPLGVSTSIEIGGRFLVLTLGGREIEHAVSRRVQAKATRERLRRWIETVARPDEHWRLRTAAADATAERLAEELSRLRGHAASLTPDGPPAVLTSAPDTLTRALESFAEPPPGRPTPAEIWIDDGALHARAVAWCAATAPHLSHRLRRARAEDRLFERLGVVDAIAEGLGRAVALDGGGRLVIDRTTALTSIDVDRQGRDGSAFEVNRAALKEIARQIRLRASQGLIVIDFLRMPAAADRARLTAGLAEALAGDSAALHGFTKGGLFELTRPRGRAGLADLSALCPPCDGTGVVAAPRHLALDALERATLAGATTLRLEPTVAAALRRLPAALAEAGLRLGRPITILADPSLPSHRFEIDP